MEFYTPQYIGKLHNKQELLDANKKQKQVFLDL